MSSRVNQIALLARIGFLPVAVMMEACGGSWLIAVGVISATSRSCSCSDVLTDPDIGDMTGLDADVLSVFTRSIRVPIIADRSWALVRLDTGPMMVAEQPSRHELIPARPHNRSISPTVW